MLYAIFMFQSLLIKKCFLTIIVLLHFLLFISIFDIYFSSPLLQNLKSISPLSNLPAKRIVLFVADGLRQDKFYENAMQHTIFLKHKAKKIGVHGISHTRVPTESRPGHVAMIAGFYEDVASVTKGWQENAVPFDSVFNQSVYTWSWGSPDILSMFSKTDYERSHIFTSMYSAEDEKFGSSNSSLLDIWVFEKVKEFFTQALMDSDLNSKLKSNQVVFFLHLLGMDSCGHSKKPHSSDCAYNLKLVDTEIKAITRLIDNFFNDDRTAYIFTSDHGMTDWGSHGTGDAQETMTPFVAWGAGISHVNQFININQADICPLMAVLLNICIPVNSVGTLPHDILDVNMSSKASSLRQNALHLMSQFLVKRKEKLESTLTFLFEEFKLSPDGAKLLDNEAVQLLKNESYSAAIDIWLKLGDLCLEGLIYFHRYDRLFHGFCVSLIFILMMLHILCEYNNFCINWSMTISKEHRYILFFGLVFLLSQCSILLVERRSILHCFYFLTPPVMAYLLFYRIYNSSVALGSVRRISITYLFILLAVQVTVVAFFYRIALTFGLFLISIWPRYYFTRKSAFGKWFLACLLVSIFPLLPVCGTHVSLFNICFGAGTIIVCTWIIFYEYSLFNKKLLHFITAAQLLAALLCLAIHAIILCNATVPLLMHFCCWLLLIFVIPLAIYISSSLPKERFVATLGALGAMLILMTTSYEAFFYGALFYLIAQWVTMEQAFEKDNVIHDVMLKDLRRALFFMFFSIFSFFGTGNIASVNTFNPSSVYSFLTTFRPFVMGFIMIIKLIFPLLAVACGWALIQQHSIGVHAYRSVLLSVFLSDFASLHFFFLVRDQGSWLEIGTSISHYVISMAQTLVLLLAGLFARLLLFYQWRPMETTVP